MSTCSIEDCGAPFLARGWCAMHYARWRRHGTPHKGASRKGQGFVTEQGYRWIGKKGHPLAIGEKQNVREHRMVLYDDIGDGAHGCYWCGTLVAWIKAGNGTFERLVVDHLDGDKSNNDRANLVPACQPCNTSRHKWGGIRPVGVHI